MLRGYVDDSGSEPSSQHFVLAGYVLPADVWARFSDAWHRELRNNKPISCLHMKHLGKHEGEAGQFKGWTIEEIEEKLLQLAAVIHAFQPLALAAHAPWSEFQRFRQTSSLSVYIENPYKALLHEITRLMYEAAKRHNNRNSVDFVFDKQGPIGTEAVSWYKDMKEAFPRAARPLFGNVPRFDDDSVVMPLQAADMFAWFQRRRLYKPVVREKFLEVERLITKGFTIGWLRIR